ncbi:MAG: TIGR00270 family protein [Thaumarchaeota archaeon RBG_16_49_8]|nr:MAG: TIGR00270 family protein [Thaumarchaeota archaeon RBG_16_49_8]
MPEICEICGNPVRGPVSTIQVDGGIFRVCPTCSRLGKPVKMPGDAQPAPPIRSSPPPRSDTRYDEPELELRPDYYTVIKNTREKMGLSQEDLGKKLNEKLSVVKHLETGKLKPDNILTRKLEHFFKVKLLVPEDEDIEE